MEGLTGVLEKLQLYFPSYSGIMLRLYAERWATRAWKSDYEFYLNYLGTEYLIVISNEGDVTVTLSYRKGGD